jgi:hypothetical protein
MKDLAGGVMTVLLAVAMATATAGPAAADVTDVGGSGAFGVSVTATVVGGPTVDVGPIPSVDLPADGGNVSDDLASADASPVLDTGLLQVSSEGGNLGTHQGFATSLASVADVTVVEDAVDGDPLLAADLITAQCTSNGDGSVGQSSLFDAEVAGNPIAVNPPPNTTIPIGSIATVVLNEQIVTNTPGVETKITVNAVHITLNVGGISGEVIISQARCRAAGPNVLGGPPSGSAAAGGPGGPAGPAAPVSATPRFTG